MTTADEQPAENDLGVPASVLRIVAGDETAARVIPGPSMPLPVARQIVREEYTDADGHVLLRWWRGDWWRFVGPHWTLVEGEALRRELYLWLEDASWLKWDSKAEAHVDTPWAPDRTKIDKVVDALQAVALIPRDVEQPSWLSTGEPASGLVPCRNGLVDVDTGVVTPTTPDYFGSVAVPFDYDPDAPEPTAWLQFLRSLWPDGGDDEIACLQEWMGYVLSGDLSLQKIGLILGPPRCGKGSIGRVLKALMGGSSNVAAPTLSTFGQNFGMQNFIGKPLAIVGDARVSKTDQEQLIERMLSISGQDAITVDRKNQQAWTGTLPTRLMVLSNDVPKFADASGAITSRFVIMKITVSFLGREDPELGGRLQAELPSILRWSLQGLERLRRTGRFTRSQSAEETAATFADLVSPIGAFLREACRTHDEEGQPRVADQVPFGRLYELYGEWCEENGRGQKNTAGFSADLQAALPHVKTNHRPRVKDEESGQWRSLPRQVQGLALNPEWVGRIKETSTGLRVAS